MIWQSDRARTIRECSNRAKENYTRELKQYEASLEAWKIRKKAHDETYKTQIKKGKDSDTIELIREDEPQPPTYYRYKTDDPTMEKSENC